MKMKVLKPILLAIMYVAYSKANNIAEEINHEVRNWQDSVSNDPKIWRDLDPDAEDIDTEDADPSPSEMIETLALPPELEGDIPMKRPRRRRRRRRRKRPKLDTDLDAYYAIADDETQQKPYKYRNVVDEDFVRRRPMKRRRRPFVRPIDDERQNTTDSGQETIDQPLQVEAIPAEEEIKPRPRLKSTTRPDIGFKANRAKPESHDSEPAAAIIAATTERQSTTQTTTLTENLSDRDTIIVLKRKRRPLTKTNQTDIIETTEMPTISPTASTTSAIETTETSYKSTKNFILQKLRRLPPASVILQRVQKKLHPNITVVNNTTSSKPDELLFTNEISNKADQANTTDGPGYAVQEEITENPADNFEFPIITYTGQRHLRNDTISTTTSTTEASVSIIYAPCNHTLSVSTTTETFPSSSEVTSTNRSSIGGNITSAENDIFEILKSESGALKKILDSKNMTIEQLIQHRERGSSQQHLARTFNKSSGEDTTATSVLSAVELDEGESVTQSKYILHTREPKLINQKTTKKHLEMEREWKLPPSQQPTFNKDIVISYTSIPDDIRENEIAHYLNTSYHRKIYHDNVKFLPTKQDRKRLPLAVKSAIIISGAILLLAILGFFALLLSCKIRQARCRMKSRRELYCEQFKTNEFRQSSRSTSPVVGKSKYDQSKTYCSNEEANTDSNRNYYLWHTLRRTFQYD